MKYKRLLFCIVSTFIFLLFLGLAKTSFAADPSHILFTAQNGGDANSTVSYTIIDLGGRVIANDALDVPAFSTKSVQTSDYLGGGGYYIVWEPSKIYGPDPRDVTCRDPITQTAIVSLPAGDIDLSFHYARAYFECWKPYISETIPVSSPPPAPTMTPASNLQNTRGCESSTSVKAGFTWNLAQPYNMSVSEQWLDFALNPELTFAFQNRRIDNNVNVHKESGFAPNTTYYWRINTKGSNGQWYPSEVKSFATPNCYLPPIGLNVDAGCFGTAPYAVFRWTRAFPNEPLWLEVSSNSGFNGFWNRDVKGLPEIAGWSANSPLSLGAVPQFNTTYYWRLWDTRQRVSGGSFSINDCRPDLVVNLNNVPDLTVGQSYNFTGIVHNSGSASAAGSIARFCVAPTGVNQDCYNNGNTIVGLARNVGTLNPGSQQSLTSDSWIAPNTGQNTVQYTAWLCADVTKQVAETNETNNCDPEVFNVIPGQQPVSLSVTHNCSGNFPSVNFSWSNVTAQPEIWIDVSTNNFANFSNKNVTTAGGSVSWNSTKPMADGAVPQNNTSYQWRIWDGQTHRLGQSFTTNNCQSVCTGTIMGTKWSETHNKPFDTANGLPGATASIAGNGVSYTFGPSTNPYSKSVGASSSGLVYSVSVTGVSGWVVKAWVANDGTANGWHPISAPGQGTSVNVPVTCGGNVSVWFYFWEVPAGTTTPSPSPIGYNPPTNLRAISRCDSSQNLEVVFSWTLGSEQTLWLDVSESNFNGYANKNVSGQSSFVWKSSNTMSNGFSPQFSKTYQWRMWDGNHGQNEHWHFATNATVTTPADCTPNPVCTPDIDDRGLTILHDASGQQVTRTNPAAKGEKLRAEIRFDSDVINCDVTNFRIDFWANPGGIPDDCITAGSTFNRTASTNGKDVLVTSVGIFNAPNVDGTYDAWSYLDSNCRITELSENNNKDVARYYVGFLPDLIVDAISFKKDPFTTFSPGEIVEDVYIRVKNIGQGNATDVHVRFFGDLEDEPSCASPNPRIPGPYLPAETTVPSVTANGGTATWGPFTFAAPTTPGAKTAWARVACGTAQTDNTNDTKSKSYNVGSNAWFETRFGDVGSRGEVKVSGGPATRYQSGYVLASKTLTGARYERWGLRNYGKNMVPPASASSGAVYSFFEARFLTDAKINSGHCIISGGVVGLVHCAGNAEFGGGEVPTGKSVWFIEGDLVIRDNLQLADSDMAVFIVKGNITIDTNVTRADGVYIAGGTFTDATSGNSAGSQLVMDGAVYARAVSLPRVLGGACTGLCDNNLDPALQVNFEPKYLVEMNELLGSPSLVWEEIEP